MLPEHIDASIFLLSSFRSRFFADESPFDLLRPCYFPDGSGMMFRSRHSHVLYPISPVSRLPAALLRLLPLLIVGVYAYIARGTPGS